MLTTLSDRWHEETNNFHIHIEEMTVTLDDMVCLLHIPLKEDDDAHGAYLPGEWCGADD